MVCHRSYVLVCVFAAIVCMHHSSSSHAGELSLPDLVVGMKNLRGQVKSFTVTLSVEGKMRTVTGTSLSNNFAQPANSTVVFTWKYPNKFAYDTRGPYTKTDGSLTPPQFRKGAYNGTSQKEITGETSATRGWIGSEPVTASLVIDPRDIFFSFIGEELNNIVSEQGTSLESITSINGVKQFTVLSPESLGIDGIKRRYRLVIVPMNGFATARREALQFVEARKAWLPYYIQEFTNYTITDSGVWVPKNAVNTTFVINQKQDLMSEVRSQSAVVFNNYSLNVNVNDDAFEVVFPTKLQITDRRTGKEMVVCGRDRTTTERSRTRRQRALRPSRAEWKPVVILRWSRGRFGFGGLDLCNLAASFQTPNPSLELAGCCEI